MPSLASWSSPWIALVRPTASDGPGWLTNVSRARYSASDCSATIRNRGPVNGPLADGVTITATGLASAAGLAAGLASAAGDGLAPGAGEGLATGLGLGAGSASMAVGVATCGEPTGVGGLVTLAVCGGPSGGLLQAATSTLRTASSMTSRINLAPRGSSNDRTQVS